jgi:AraC family transcriptional regulator
MGNQPRRTGQNGFGIMLKHDLVQSRQPRRGREFAKFHCTLTTQLMVAIVYLTRERQIVTLSILDRRASQEPKFMNNNRIRAACLIGSQVLSSQQIGWKDIIVEHSQSPVNSKEGRLPALSEHWLNFSLAQLVYLTQNHDDRLRESIVYQGDLILVPAGQPTYWRSWADEPISTLSIYLKPELIAQIVEVAELDPARVELIRCFSQADLPLYQIAAMLLAELRSGGMMGELYIESLTQVLIIHLLRQYSGLPPIVTNRHNLTHNRVQSAIDYIHTHLDSDLSMVQIANSVNSSPNYFAVSFKKATGISLHQYVIKQRVERAKLLLETTELPIANIASQVGFASSSHLTHHCKRLTGMTPTQISKTIRIC